MNLKIIKIIFDKVALIQLPKVNDNRGNFLKIFSNTLAFKKKFKFNIQEVFYSTSSRGVVRGMHFQNPNSDHDKIITCINGEVDDVILDIRTKSPYYKKFFSINLSAKNNLAIFIPKGFAHGFQSLENDSSVLYMTSHIYDKKKDKGLLHDSFGYKWSIKPKVSKRDLSHPSLSNFKSKF